MGKLLGFLFVIILLAAGAAGAGWVWLNGVYSGAGPASDDGKPRVVMVERGASTQAIATKLKDAGAIADAEQFDGGIQRYPPRTVRDAAHAVFQVAAHAEVREQAGLLKHIAQRSLVRGQPLAAVLARLLIVLPGLTVYLQAALRRTLQPGDAAQQRGFA